MLLNIFHFRETILNLKLYSSTPNLLCWTIESLKFTLKRSVITGGEVQNPWLYWLVPGIPKAQKWPTNVKENLFALISTQKLSMLSLQDFSLDKSAVFKVVSKI